MDLKNVAFGEPLQKEEEEEEDMITEDEPIEMDFQPEDLSSTPDLPTEDTDKGSVDFDDWEPTLF